MKTTPIKTIPMKLLKINWLLNEVSNKDKVSSVEFITLKILLDITASPKKTKESRSTVNKPDSFFSINDIKLSDPERGVYTN